MGRELHLFVPGRLCLFGEHTDWAGMYRTVNSSLIKGQAIVTGIEQGIYATAKKSEQFIVTSDLDMYGGEKLSCIMDTKKLIEIAQQGGFFSYVAGVAAYINDNYSVGGVEINVTKMDLPIKSGLSSSAAICVLVARAFNQLYHLKMNTKGEMQAAFRGEQRTPSRCGRLDQACAYGIKPVLMDFDGVEIDSRELRIGSSMHWVIANLMASKDTIKILADLNKCYPFAESDLEKRVQEALGLDNKVIIEQALEALKEGNAKRLGELMDRWQENFDEKVMPACTELKAPVLHSVMKDPVIRKWIYGAKGVGSQGDGSVQFLVKDEDAGKELQDYLDKEKGMPSFSLTLKPGQTVKKAIIPLAGFGTRVFPATKCSMKCFMPLLDEDGMLKPALLIMLEELIRSEIEEICLIISEDEQADFERFFAPLPDELKDNLSNEKRRCEERIQKIKNHVTFVYQRERLGFGHAVWHAKQFAGNDPVLLLLGDFVYKSFTGIPCSKQIIDAYTECGITLVSIEEIPLERVVHYGILHGQWNDSESRLLNVDRMVEKPTHDFAREYLGVADSKGVDRYYATFGQYVLTPEVFEELDKVIKNGNPNEGKEFGLTDALEKVRTRYGMCGFCPEGISYDIGLPESYRNTMWEFVNKPEQRE